MEVIDLKCPKYIDDYIELWSLEWGKNKTKSEMQEYIKRKKNKILDGDKYISILGLIDKNELIGFISLFKTDGDDRTDLSPWYVTMYVKEKYRNKGYSKILNNEILKKAKELGYQKVYLKADLNNYYEKFGARYIERLPNGEKIYCIDLENKIEDEISKIKNVEDVYEFMDKNIQYGKVYHIEHPNFDKKGIYEYSSEEEAVKTIEN